MHIVIMGCGRVGSSLARAVERLGHTAAVIDRNEDSFRRLPGDFRGERVVGAGYDRSVLAAAGIERAGAFAAISDGDNSNIIAARVARENFGVERVLARIYDHRRAEVYERLGIPTVATVPWTTDRFLRALLPGDSVAAWREPTGTMAVLPLPFEEHWVGATVRRLQRATGSRVAFLMRFGTGIVPDDRTVLQADDIVYVAASSGTIRETTEAAARPPGDEDEDTD